MIVFGETEKKRQSASRESVGEDYLVVGVRVDLGAYKVVEAVVPFLIFRDWDSRQIFSRQQSTIHYSREGLE